MSKSAVTWTAPYYGVQHTQTFAHGCRCSVQNNGPWAELHMWFEGCGFSPKTSHHDTVREAREAGEKWLADRVTL
jgi:hypothetical protein